MNRPEFDVLKFSPDPTRQSMPLTERVRQLEVENAELANQCDQLRKANAWLSDQSASMSLLLSQAGPVMAATRNVDPEKHGTWLARYVGLSKILREGVPKS